MSILKRRLINLWDRQTIAPFSAHPWPRDFHDQISVTLGVPTIISGTVLQAGRYEFRPLHRGVEHTPVQVFNADQTKLVATFATA